MGLGNYLTRYFYKQFMKEVDDKYLRALWRTMVQGGTMTEIQDNADAYIQEGYQGNSDVYSIVRRYVTMSRQASLKLMQKMSDGSEEEVTDHELNKFLIEANPNQTMMEFKEAYDIYLLVTGNSFWYKPALENGLNAGKTTEIYTLPSNDIEIIQGLNRMTAPVKAYKLESSDTVFDPHEVYHDKYFNPNFYTDSTLFGQSPLQAAANIVSKQNQAAETEAKQFENQGPPYIMFRNSENDYNSLTPQQKTELEKELQSAKQGKQKQAKVLRDKFDIIQLGQSLVDLNIIESTQDGRRILCNVYQFPVSLFNDPEGSTYNNVSTARKAAWTDALIPHNDQFASAMTNFLIRPVEEYVKAGYYFKMDYTEVEELQSGLKERVEWMSKAKWTGNEIREGTGKDKIDEDYMNEPIFNQGDVLGDELSLDPNLEAKDYGDYGTNKQ
jgi:HK97 family phage portal protein